VYLEVHRDVYNRGVNPRQELQARLAQSGLAIDWALADAVLGRMEGVARPVGLPERNWRHPLTLERRRFLTLVAGLAVARPALAQPPERRLALVNLHTGEALDVVYWAQGRYRDGALADLAHLLRDHRSGEIGPIAPALLDVLHELAISLNAAGPIEIVSAYRSPATNDWLAQNTGGVSRTSLHTRGMAADIRLPERPLEELHRAALDLRAGGVGLYPASGFVHVDIGRVRSWIG
jgi:uncharacterized protein YcbK (DUF882 family)